MEGVSSEPEPQSPFWRSLKEVKLCYAKLQNEIAALEESFQQELQWHVAQQLNAVEAGTSPEKTAQKRPGGLKKKKKIKGKVDLPPADTMDVNLEGADGGDGADDTGSRDHAELDVTDVEEQSEQKIPEEHPRALTFAFDDEEDGQRSDADSATKSQREENHEGNVSLNKSTSSAAMARVRTHHGASVDPQVKAYTTELREEQDKDQEALNERLQLAKTKLESCRRKSNITIQQVGFFLSVVMGKKSMEVVDHAEVRWLFFEFFAALMIVVNSVVMGLEVAHLASHMSPSQPLQIISLLFTNWFILEVIIRIRVTGIRNFFTKHEWMWNLCDLVLVFISIVELGYTSFGTSSTSRSPLSTLRAIKIIRVVRLFRLFRYFPQLAKLALMVADSVRQLLWALVMFILIMYVWAVTLTEGCTDWLKLHVNVTDGDAAIARQIEDSQVDGLKEVHRFFGSLDRSIYTLFQVSLGGVSWHQVTDAVGYVDWFYFMLLFAYVIFTILALMNVFTGVFVDKAVQNSKKQRKSQIEEAIDKKRTILDQIVEFFVATDVNGDGTISAEEIHTLLHDPVMSAYFDMIGFRPGDAKLVAELLDHDNSGDISLHEFINGCERLRGDAKGIDIHLLLMECYQINDKLDRLQDSSSAFNPQARGRHRASYFANRMKKTLSNLSK